MRIALALFLVLITNMRAMSATPATLPAGVRMERIMMPMRDGVGLSTYLYFPPGNGPWPVLYQERYLDISGASTQVASGKLAAAGYVVAMQNFRGAQLSDGKWVGYRALGWGKLQDGYDSIEWLARQPWSNGKIGMFGGSQAGFAQNFAAVTQAPHLVCQFMTDTGLSLYHEGYRIGGVTRPERFKQMETVCRVPADNRELLVEWLAHPTFDDYWKDEDCSLHFDRMNVPCFTLGSWYDFMCYGSIESFIGRQHKGGPNSRGAQQLLIGPWLHGGAKSNVINQMKFPENAKIDLDKQMLRWFDHYLKGVANDVEHDPVVRYYVMGATGEPDSGGNVWRSATDWPVPATATPYYLHAGGSLSTETPAEDDSTTSFKADPIHPAQIPVRPFPGAIDARPFETQAEVKTFTTAPLMTAVEWTGRVRAELFVSSSAPDTDFIVRVSDVYPDGRSILIIDYVRRARYREGYEREVMMQPGKVYPVNFDVGSLSQVFNKGHRIRVTVASTGSFFYEPNPNTGEPFTLDFPKNAIVAENAVHHGKIHASRILAPVHVE